MSALNSQRTPEELARLGAEMLDHRVRPMLRPDDDGKFVAIDVGTGDFELDFNDYAAVARLGARRPHWEDLARPRWGAGGLSYRSGLARFTVDQRREDGAQSSREQGQYRVAGE
jgi:hypothetical protein